jgi:hypothetical protein
MSAKMWTAPNIFAEDFFLGQEDDILVAAAARRPVRSFKE